MAQETIPLAPAMTEILVFGLLIAARNAARVALGRLHVGPAPLERRLLILLYLGTLARPALRLFAVRRHRSSVVERQFNRAYHLTTG
jgi:hypothetical protein